MFGRFGLEMYERARKAEPHKITEGDVKRAEEIRLLMARMAKELADEVEAGNQDE